MYRYVTSSNNVTPPSKARNILAKAISKRLQGSYDISVSSTEAFVRSTVLYQIPVEVSRRYNLSKEEQDEVKELDLLISLATYSDKIRVNVFEVEGNLERTLGFRAFNNNLFVNMQAGIETVVKWILDVIGKRLDGYDILY